MIARNTSGTCRGGASAAGFTLIELVITIAVVGILMAIAIESYEFAMVKTRRGAAQSCLTEAAQFMERVYTTTMSYESVTAFPALACKSDASLTPHYSFPDPTVTASTFTLTAIPQGRQATADTQCGTMTINERGRKTASITTGTCW